MLFSVYLGVLGGSLFVGFSLLWRMFFNAIALTCPPARFVAAYDTVYNGRREAA